MATQEQIRREFIAVCQRAFKLGMQLSTGGNISARLDSGNFLVKPSGLSLYDLSVDDLVVCDAQGKVLQGQGKPTKEIASHLTIYETRPDVRAVVHYHPPHATAYAAAGLEIPLLTVHARRILGRLAVVGPPGEGGDELVGPVRHGFEGNQAKAVLLAEHGIIAVGKSLTQAQNLAELVEECAKVAFIHSQLQNSGPA